VQQLRPVWIYQVQGRDHFESTPLVFDGVMCLTDPPSDVVALDIKTGRPGKSAVPAHHTHGRGAVRTGVLFAW
jgi:glucose dehydrogenase